MTFRAAVPTTILAADASDGVGRIKALVSAYDVKYQIGFNLWHTIRHGAAAGSLERQASIPVFWMHGWSANDLPPIGHTTAADEADEGLVLDTEFYLDDSELARTVYRANKAQALTEWSIGYDILAADVDADDEAHEFVTELELLEASSVLRGANPATETLQVAQQLYLPPEISFTSSLTIEETVTEPDPPADDETPAASADVDLSRPWVREHIRST